MLSQNNEYSGKKKKHSCLFARWGKPHKGFSLVGTFEVEYVCSLLKKALYAVILQSLAMIYAKLK